MGRGELQFALASIAALDYPNVEALVVDATGGHHPALPAISWPAGHSVRLVASQRPLPRPLAAQAGLDAASGEFVCFLDDDDTYLPNHLSALVPLALAHPDAPLVYARGNSIGPDGNVRKVFGMPFNRMMLFYRPLFYWQASLIRTRVRDLGCAFDPQLSIMEDIDFIRQIADHGNFVYSDAITFNFRSDIGTSGTGTGGNRDFARIRRFDNLLSAKWVSQRIIYGRHPTAGCKAAIAAYMAGNRDSARALFSAVLAEYPNDPNALHGSARLHFESAQLSEALRCARLAAELNPGSAEFQFTLAQICEASALYDDSLAAATLAEPHPAFAVPARALIGRLSALRTRATVAAGASAPSAEPSPVLSRNARCHCGSGKRYKDCHGALSAALAGAIEPGAVTAEIATAVVSTVNSLSAEVRMDAATQAASSAMVATVANAGDLWRRGEAFAAKQLLDSVNLDALMDADSVRAAANMQLGLGLYEQAYETARQLGRFPESPRSSALCDQIASHQFRPLARASLAREINALTGNCATDASGDPSLVPASGKVLAIADVHAELDQQLAQTGARKVMLTVSSDALDTVLDRVATIREALPDANVQLIVPSRSFGAACHLNNTIVEYPETDVVQFHPGKRRPAVHSKFAVGRHSSDDPTKHHPNDPSLHRSLMASGCEVVILGGSCLLPAFANDAGHARPQLLAAGSVTTDEFLATLDCWVYRLHPQTFVSSGRVILEAMAMALPVVLFADNLEAAEIISHGVDGFIVSSEDEARTVIAQLRDDPSLAARIGQAARHRVESLMIERRRVREGIYAV